MKVSFKFFHINFSLRKRYISFINILYSLFIVTKVRNILLSLVLYIDQPLCSHMSAPNYFAESITSEVGFWGVRCENYFDYLIGKCGQTESMEDEEDEDEEGFSLFRNGKRINGLPEHREDEEGNRRRPTKPQWQLMGEHCNAR